MEEMKDNINKILEDEEINKEDPASKEDISKEDASKEDASKEDASKEDASKEAADSFDDREKAAENTQEEASDGTSGKKFFRKSDKKTDALKQRVEELEDRTRRQMAEFENFRKRSEKEKAFMFETGARSVIEKILPVVDNFERGLSSIPEEERNSPFSEGMNMIYKQLMSELESIGVKPIEAIGQEFDPELHNAVMQTESDEYESGIITQEMLKGYMYRDTVVRHSMVGVVS